MKRMFRNGFGLLELIVVSLIIAIALIIIVTIVLNNINVSKKEEYIDIVKMYVEAARIAAASEKVEIPSDMNHATFIGFEQLKPFIENVDSTSSYGNDWDTEHSFIVIVNEGTANDRAKYTYYVAAWDGEYALGEVTDDNETVARIILESDLSADTVVNTKQGADVPSNSKYSQIASKKGFTYLLLDPEGLIQMFSYSS